MSARNRELFGLIPASLLVTAGFTAVFIQRNDLLSNLSLTYGALFLALCLAAHLVVRMTLPDADPYMFPLVAVLACFGLVMLYRLDEDFARDQAQWFVVGLLAFSATIVLLRRDYRVLERYRYSIALLGIFLLLLPRLGHPVNGAYLSLDVGPIAFQPAEFAKIAIVIFLASYLSATRQVLVVGARRFAGITFPPLKHLGPLLAVWGTAMVLLFVIQDLGSSLMFFGGFLALVYVATNRISFVLIGVALFALGARLLYAVRPTIQGRVDAWLHPFDHELYDKAVGGSFQIAQSIFSQADGGLFGQGFGQAVIQLGDNSPILPAAHTDFIYAVITDELGLLGAAAVLLVYLLFVERGFKTAMLATDSFSKLLATGLTAVLALQVFVIVGGVT
jgi:cell division protein FtsW (lipid II flippase)